MYVTMAIFEIHLPCIEKTIKYIYEKSDWYLHNCCNTLLL